MENGTAFSTSTDINEDLIQESWHYALVLDPLMTAKPNEAGAQHKRSLQNYSYTLNFSTFSHITTSTFMFYEDLMWQTNWKKVIIMNLRENDARFEH